MFSLKNPKYYSNVPTLNLQKKVSNMYGTGEPSNNPFTDNQGNLLNPNIDYQKILDNPKVSTLVKNFIARATGLASTTTTPQAQVVSAAESYTAVNSDKDVKFNANADPNNLGSLDVSTELPKLTKDQIEKIITQHFGNSTVVKPSDAQGIYDAQQKTGMSALAILGIGALESGYGTSNIAKKKNNIWGWNATNSDPAGNAKTFSQMSQGAYEFANSYMNTYYNGYGAKSISSAGTGNNPSKKGYAYNDDGTINSNWATNVGSIMGKFYNTAKGN